MTHNYPFNSPLYTTSFHQKIFKKGSTQTILSPHPTGTKTQNKKNKKTKNKTKTKQTKTQKTQKPKKKQNKKKVDRSGLLALISGRRRKNWSNDVPVPRVNQLERDQIQRNLTSDWLSYLTNQLEAARFSVSNSFHGLGLPGTPLRLKGWIQIDLMILISFKSNQFFLCNLITIITSCFFPVKNNNCCKIESLAFLRYDFYHFICIFFLSLAFLFLKYKHIWQFVVFHENKQAEMS